MDDFMSTTENVIVSNNDITNTWISKAIVDYKYLIAVFTGIMLTLDIIILKKNPYLLENKAHTLFWLYLSNSLISCLLMAIFENLTMSSNWLDMFYMSLHSVVFMLIQPLYMIAASHITGNTINVFYSSIVIFMLVPQYTILSDIHPGNRNWIEALGAVLVFLGTILTSLLEIFKNRMQFKCCAENDDSQEE